MFVLETVIIVPTANTVAEQSVRNENIEQIRQSREIGPDNQQSNVKHIGSSTLLAGAKSGKSSETHKNDENQPENDDEKYLMSKKVYQTTTEPVNKEDNQRSSKWGSVNCRTILWYISFVGFMVNYMYRININIAIVEMVSIKKTTISNDHHTSECVANQLFESPANATTTLNVNSIRFVSIFTVFHHFKHFFLPNTHKKLDLIDGKTTFEWNELEQNRVLGAFFWLHWTTQIFGGIFAARYGTKLIFGLSNFLSSFLCLFVPIAANWHINYLIALRIAQGLIGVTNL